MRIYRRIKAGLRFHEKFGNPPNSDKFILSGRRVPKRPGKRLPLIAHIKQGSEDTKKTLSRASAKCPPGALSRFSVDETHLSGFVSPI